MARVKMNAKHEYEFIGNFKILQNTFRSHKVEKVRRLLVVCCESPLNPHSPSR